MTIENIGLERLPNIYFRKINLEDHDTKSFKVVSELVVMDENIDSILVWSADPLLSGFMKTCIVETSNQELIQQITDGVQNPHPSLLKSNPLSTQDTKIHLYGVKDFKKMGEGESQHFVLTSSIAKQNETSRLTFFAFNYLDHREISKYLHIKLTGPLQQYMGPVVSEEVMSNSLLRETSAIFYKPNNDVWSGPVHQGAGGEWFSGASADSQETFKLTRKVVKNTKLTDNRSLYIKNRGQSNFKKLSIFGDLLTSLNSDADLFGVFSINMKQLVLMKTQSGKKIYELGPEMFSSFLDSVTINSIEIRRRQVKFHRQTNYLGTTIFSKKDVLPYETIAVTQETSPRALTETENLKEITITKDRNIRTFQFSDFDKAEESRGEFVYEVHLTILDKTQLFLESLILDMENTLNSLKVDVNLLHKVKNYNDDFDRLEVDVPNSMSLYIKQFYENYSIIKEIDEDRIQQLKLNKRTMFTKDNYRKKFGLSFIVEWEKMISAFKRRFGVFPTGPRHNRKMPSTAQPPNLISLSKTFNNKISFSAIRASYDVLGIAGNKQMVKMTKEDFLNRAELEVDRFFDLSKSQISDEMLDMDKEDSNALKDLETSKLGFLAPISFQAKGQRKDITSLMNIDIDDISVKFIKHLEEEESKKIENPVSKVKQTKPKRRKGRLDIFKKRKGRMKFVFKPTILKTNDLKLPDYLNSSEYLGDNSEFVNSNNNLSDATIASNTEQVQLTLKLSSELSVKRSKKRFDLREKNNFYEKFKSSRVYTPKKLRMMPISTKSILNSRSTAAKNNIMEEEVDILKLTNTKVATEMIFQVNQKIEALVGYELAPDGTKMMNKPIWGEITRELLDNEQSILCRLTYLEMPELGIIPAPEFMLKVQNEVFLVEGEGRGQQTTASIPDEELSKVENIIYASSNIVIQPTGVSNA